MEHQLGTFGHQWIVEFIGGIGWLMVRSFQHAIIVENDGNAFAGKIEMVAPVIDPVLVVGVVEFVIQGHLDELIVHQIDRLGRNLLDILKTIAFFNTKKVNIEFKKQGLRTLNEDGSENDISKMVISILGVVAEMERKMIRERQLEGIAIAKANISL